MAPALVENAGEIARLLADKAYDTNPFRAVLAARALQALPSVGVARQADVEALHEKARDALATVEAELWTSDNKGFRGERVLGRELTIVSGGTSPR